MKKLIKKLLRESLYSKLITENSNNQNAIELTFKENPELNNIGSPESYSNYLKTIFPDTKIKDIVYHNSSNKIEKFRKTEFGTYFAPSPIDHGGYGNVINCAILNIKNPLTLPKGTDSIEVRTQYNKDNRSYNNPISYSPEGIGEFKYDGSIEQSSVTKEGYQIKVRDPEQIHILGSKADIEGFNSFINK
jgi:hypothetical protein